MSESPRVAFYVRDFLSPTMTFVYNRLLALSDSLDVSVFCLRRRNADRFPFSRLQTLASGSLLPARVRRALHRRLRHVYPPLPRSAAASLRRGLLAERIGILHAAFGTEGVEAEVALRGTAVRLVVAFAGYDSSSALRDPCYVRSIRRVGAVMGRGIAVCEHLKNRLVSAGLPAGRIEVIHDGIRLEEFPWSASMPDDDGRIRLSHLSGFTPKKGVPDLLRGLASARARGLPAELHLGGDGPLRSSAEELVRELGLGASVTFHGYVAPEERARFMRLGQVFVHPSRTDARGDEEGIPNALKEAMALGMPVVSTLHAGIPELVDDGVEGWLVPEGDPDAIAGALVACAESADRWPEMGAAGRRRVEAEFSLAAEVSRLRTLYGEVAAGADY